MLHCCKCLQFNMRKWKRNTEESPGFSIAFLIKPWWKQFPSYKFFATFPWPQQNHPFLTEQCAYAAWNNSIIVPVTNAAEPSVGVMRWFYLGRVSASLYSLCRLRKRRKHHVIKVQDYSLGNWGWITLGSAQGLYLALQRGSLQAGTMCGAGSQTWVCCVEASTLIPVLSLSPGLWWF